MAVTVIRIAAVDLTDRVIFKGAHFDSRVNGQPGPCEFRVRDDDNDLTFEVGQSITVDIDGQRVWAGYLMMATSTYILSVEPTPVTARTWSITGVDLNILFRRRVTVDPVDPTQMAGKTYKYTGTPTPDTTAIAALVTDFLDLTGDDLDVSTFVDNVGNINVDQDANAFAAAWTWEQAMTSIAALPAAIFYLDPDRNLVYTDVDTVDAPFALSDTPDGTTSFGYRDAELLKDASNLINEYLAWGIGTGSNLPVFSRLEDTDSVTEHGRWQGASVTYDAYTQATVDRIADSWVNGSPASQRGHKDDKIAFVCTVFEPGLRGGMKVDVTSGVFGFNDVMPIRELRLTWATQDDPVFRLTLSHAIDAPWSFYEMFNPSVPKFAWDDQFTLVKPPACPQLCETPTYQPASDDYLLAHPYIKYSLEVTIDDVPVTVVKSDPAGGIFEYETGDQSAGMVACYVVPTPASGVACYCVEETTDYVIDDFGRSVVTGWGTATGPDYNVTTPASAWVKGPASSTTTESVDGDKGVSNNSGGSGFELGTMVVPIPTVWFAGADWIECRWLVETTIGNQQWGLYNASLSRGIYVGARDNESTSILGMQFGKSQSGGSFWNINGSAGVNMDGNPFWMALHLESGVLQAKSWADGDTEPDWLALTITGVSLTVDEIARARYVDGQHIAAGVIKTDHIVARVSSCVDVFPIDSEIDGVQQTDGTDTIDLGSPFWKGTSRVWLDGAAQILGVDYTEDYDGGLIIFTSTPAAGLDVVITKVSRTPCGGGASRRIS